MKLLDKNFFSLKVDIVAFTTFIPIYILHFVLAKYVNFPEHPPLVFLFVGWTLVDGSHVWSSLFVTYFDRQIMKRLWLPLCILPFCIFAAGFSSKYLGYEKPFLIFLGYLAMIHFIRQEYGWMKLASSFDKSTPRWLTWIDLSTSYVLTIFPMLWLTRASQAGFWYTEGDLFATPDIIGEWARNLCLPMIGVFILANAVHAYRTKLLNISKYLVFINTFFGWYMCRFYAANVYVMIWLLIFHHGIPYFFLVMKHERATENIGWFRKLGPVRFPIFYCFCVLIFVSFYYLHQVNPFLLSLKTEPFYRGLIYGIAVAPQMIHFVMDGFIWKRKYGLVKA